MPYFPAGYGGQGVFMIIIMLIEEDLELRKRITDLVMEKTGFECVIIQGDENSVDCHKESIAESMGGADFYQALLDSFSCAPRLDPEAIQTMVCIENQLSSYQSCCVPPRKFSGVRKIPIPAQCEGPRKKRRNWRET